MAIRLPDRFLPGRGKSESQIETGPRGEKAPDQGLRKSRNHRANSLRPAVILMMSKDRMLYLEVLRFAFAFSVLVLHYVMFIDVFFKNDPEHVWGAAPLVFLKKIFFFGSYAVPAFWQLSGFIFFWLYSSALAEGKESSKSFFVKRFSRLYPLHLLTLLLMTGANFVFLQWNQTPIPPGDNPKNFILQLFFASDWGPASDRNFNGPVWSVSVEVLVYFYFFVLIKRFGPQIWICALNILWSRILNDFKYFEGGFVECCLFFFTGGLAYLLSQKFKEVVKGRGIYLSFLVGSLAAFCPFIYYGIMSAPKTIMLLPGSLFLLLLSEIPNPTALTCKKIMENLGNLTYGSYLWHFPINVFLIELVKKEQISPEIFANGLFITAYFLGLLWLSFISYRFFELPAQTMIRKAWLPLKSFS